MDQPTAAPTRKVTAAIIAAAATTVLVWLASMLGIEVPDNVSDAVTVLLIGGASAVPILAAYFTRERSPAQHVDRDGDGIADAAQG